MTIVIILLILIIIVLIAYISILKVENEFLFKENLMLIGKISKMLDNRS